MSNNRKNSSGEEKTGGTPGWMVTFSDLATLLLTFFVLLLSMSSMDDKTLKSLFTNFTSACGILNFKEYGEVYKPKEILIEGLYSHLKDALVMKKADDPVDVPSENKELFLYEIGNQLVIENFEDGFKLVFGHNLLFSSGKAHIKEEMKPVLRKIAKFMTLSAYQVYIDGHTDSIPIKSAQYPTNMDLSLTRAFNIMDYLIIEEEISPDSIALAGYGELHPVAPNSTSEGRSNNRRVEMIFKNKSYF